MNNSNAHKTPPGQQGFVLVTSLVFLVVITLLAVSAINSSTLQERMASNLREKSRALQAADATLRHGERLLKDPIFNTLQAPDSTVSITPSDQGDDAGNISLKLWRKTGPLSDAQKNKSTAFLDRGLWGSNGSALSYEIDPKLPSEYYVEYYDCVTRDLNPDSGATCDGSAIFRITARAEGENPAAIAVTQSLYEKRY